MDMQTFACQHESGWSLDAVPDVDAGDTLVLIFGASRFLEQPDPIQELARAYPSSIIAGCSTSGEIFGTDISDDSLAVAVVSFGASRLRMATAAVNDSNLSRTAGQQLSEQLLADDLRGILVLGEATEGEVESTIEVLPVATRQAGFYSHGEISPYATGQCDLHNRIMTLTTISEAA